MNKNRIIYWVATGLFSAMMMMSAFNYFTNPEMQEVFNHLGFPEYFKIQLGTAKILGAVALLLPFVPKGFKQFAYAGFVINMLSATIAHAARGDGAFAGIMPLMLLGILIVSYVYYEKTNKTTVSKTFS